MSFQNPYSLNSSRPQFEWYGPGVMLSRMEYLLASLQNVEVEIDDLMARNNRDNNMSGVIGAYRLSDLFARRAYVLTELHKLQQNRIL